MGMFSYWLSSVTSFLFFTQEDFSTLFITSHIFLFSVLGKPLTENDIHLIMEYTAGSKWGNYTANRANR